MTFRIRGLHKRAFDAIDAGVLWYDAELRIVEANRAARRALDLGDGPISARVEHLGWKQWDEHGEPLAPERRPVWCVLHGGERGEGGAGVTEVIAIDTPRNGRRWLRVRAFAVDPADDPAGCAEIGADVRVVATFTDFTEESVATRSLRDSEQLFRMFGDHAVDVMWIVDPHARKLLYVNAAYERLWGRPAAPLYEDLAHWLDGVAPEDMARVAGAALEPTSSGTYETEYRLHRPDGRTLWIRGRGFPIFGPDGRMRYMAGFAEDITPLREAEALQTAHRLAQERLERIVATAPGAVHSYRLRPDGHGEFVFASPAIRELLGVDAVTLVDGRIDLPVLVHPDDRAALNAALRASAKQGGPWLSTFRVPGAAAGERWVEAHAMPQREADGSVVWHGFFIDITERRRVEQELQHLNAELEQRVAERTAELEAKHREMEAFTYSVSHDLKAPLRGIDGYSRLLESDHGPRLDDEGRFFLEMIRKAAAQMGELIDDLLEYSRVERGRPVLGSVSSAHVVAVVTDGVAADLGASGVAVRVAVDPALRVVGEREGLVLALRNLLDNAVKFSAGRGAPEIEIGARREGRHGLFWVRDNGPGFDMRYHDRIFEIFQRLHRAEDFPGTGVGLAIVRKAVERMHGRVWAQSAPGAGAIFFIELALAA